MILPLNLRYAAESDTLQHHEWLEHVLAFSDANVYQAWQHSENQRRLTGMSTLLLREDGQLVAAAEVRLFVLPYANRGLAYVRWGPLWRRGGCKPDHENFRQIVRALRNEYVERRRMVLRLNPRLFVEEDQASIRILEEEGFSRLTSGSVEKTLLMDLSPGLDTLRAGFDRKWRGHLNKAEREGLAVTVGTSLDFFDTFESLYDQMLQRKRFAPTADLRRHRRLQSVLPEGMKMRVVVARYEETPCAAAIYSVMGDTAIYLFGATNDVGMRTSGSYLVQWEILKLLKEDGTREYDLHGINIEVNPGTYVFKRGLAGKNGREVTFVGKTQAFRPSLSNYSILWLEGMRHRVQLSRATAADRARG